MVQRIGICAMVQQVDGGIFNFSLFPDTAFLVLVQQESQRRFVFFGGRVRGFSCLDCLPYSVEIGSSGRLCQIQGTGKAMLAADLQQEYQE